MLKRKTSGKTPKAPGQNMAKGSFRNGNPKAQHNTQPYVQPGSSAFVQSGNSAAAVPETDFSFPCPPFKSDHTDFFSGIITYREEFVNPFFLLTKRCDRNMCILLDAVGVLSVMPHNRQSLRLHRTEIHFSQSKPRKTGRPVYRLACRRPRRTSRTASAMASCSHSPG